MSFWGFRNWKTKSKILAACLFCIIFPLTFTAVFSYNRFNKIMATEAAGYTQQILIQIMNNVEGNIREIERLSLSPYLNQQVIDILESRVTSDQLVLLRNRNKVMNFIIGIRNIRNDFSGIYIFSERNENFYWNDQSLDDRQNYKETTWYRTFSSKEKTWVLLGPHVHGSNFPRNNLVFSVVRPINSVLNGDTLGYFMLDINLNTMNDFCNNTQIGRRGQIMILDENNCFAYDSDRNKLGKKADFSFLKNIATQKAFITKEGGVPKLVSSVVSPYTHWRYLSLIPLGELTSNTRTIIKYTVGVGVISILLAVLISFFLAFLITRPLQKLADIMKRVEQGDLEISFYYPYQDEIGFLGTGFNNMIFNMKELIRNVLDFRIKTKEAELEALQSKINPHFLYNTLQTLQMKAVIDRNEKLANMLELLGRYMRFSISSVKEVVDFKEELEYLNYYIELQQIRFGPKLVFKSTIQNEVLNCKILKLMIQPIIENAIGHGLEKKQGEWVLTLEAKLIADKVSIKITDNGVGMSTAELQQLNDYIFAEQSEQASMGLQNVNQRLKIIFEDNYTLSIQSAKGEGTVVEIIIPVVWNSKFNIIQKR